jgi:hypothetical protein
MNMIPAERLLPTLNAFLDETFGEHHGIYLEPGTSLFPTLDGLSAEEASQSIAPSHATIAAHAEHVRFYLEVMIVYMRGENPGPVDWKAIWKATRSVDAAEWVALRDRLRASYERVRAEVSGRTAWDDEHSIGGVIAMIVHTACHLGAIRQIMGAVRARS